MRLPLSLARDQPLQRQLYDQLRDLIASARLAPGSRMPSTRMLAEQYAISRITVVLTYERLIAEGYLETMPAKGTFVSRPSLHQGTGLAERQTPLAPPPDSRAPGPRPGLVMPTRRCSPRCAGAR